VNLLELTVQLGYAVARADGRLAQAEQTTIEQYFQNRYQHNAAMLNRARSLIAHYTKAPIDINDLVRRIKSACAPETLVSLLEFGRSVVMAGSPNTKKIVCYEQMGRELAMTLPSFSGVESSEVEAGPRFTPTPLITRQKETLPANPAFSSRKQWLEALEIDPEVIPTAELVRRQYNKLAERFSAAKVTHLGADFERLAAERHTAARMAAEGFMKEFSEPLDLPEPAPPASIRENRELDELFGG
jgi:hypothetical protein